MCVLVAERTQRCTLCQRYKVGAGLSNDDTRLCNVDTRLYNVGSRLYKVDTRLFRWHKIQQEEQDADRLAAF
jgi:hypothetical protein